MGGPRALRFCLGLDVVVDLLIWVLVACLLCVKLWALALSAIDLRLRDGCACGLDELLLWVGLLGCFKLWVL